MWAEISIQHAEMYQRLLKHRGSTLWRDHLCRSRRRKPSMGTFIEVPNQAIELNPLASHGEGPTPSLLIPPLPPFLSRTNQNTVSGSQSVPDVSQGNQQDFQTRIETEEDIHCFVLFGVKGSRRTPELAQIDTEKYQDDSAFFCELQDNYTKVRGLMRCWLSIWQFSYCDFVKVNLGLSCLFRYRTVNIGQFEKIRPNRIVFRGKDLPTAIQYEYTPRPPEAENPPISVHEFELALKPCNRSCLLRIFHDCVEPPNGTFALERIPKRRGALELNVGLVEFAWGLQARYAISFFRLLLYHILSSWLDLLDSGPGGNPIIRMNLRTQQFQALQS